MPTTQNCESLDYERLWSRRYADPQHLRVHTPQDPQTPEETTLRCFIEWRDFQLDRALEDLAPIANDPELAPRWRARAINIRACILYEMGLSNEAMAMNVEERRLAQLAGDQAGVLRARHDAAVFCSTGSSSLSVKYYRELAHIAEQHWPTAPADQSCEIRTGAAMALFNAVREEQNLKAFTIDPFIALDRCYDIARSVWPDLATCAIATKVSIALSQGDLDQASDFAAAVDQFGPVHDGPMAAIVAGAMARLRSTQGESDAAVALLHAHLEVAPEQFSCEVRADLVAVLETAGRYQEALEVSKELMTHSLRLRDTQTQHLVSALEVWYRTDEAKQAAKKAEQTVMTLAEALEELRSSHDHVLEQTRRDPLTGLHNRAYLWDVGETTLSCSQTNNPAQVGLIDLDGFKKVNDTYGHLRGDTVLREFAALITQVCPPTDLVARLGGDEFVIIRPPKAPGQLADDLAKLTIATELGDAVTALEITASIGVATVGGCALRKAIHTADCMMYKSKSRGGNAVTSHHGLRDVPPTVDLTGIENRVMTSTE